MTNDKRLKNLKYFIKIFVYINILYIYMYFEKSVYQ